MMMSNTKSNNVFFSWSEKKSNAVAYTIAKFLPFIVQNTKVFFSPDSIKKDEDWFNKIKSELINTKTGIVFLTKDNLNANWILFEAGGIMSKGSICAVLCDIDISFLIEKNSVFQYLNVTKLKDKADLLKLFLTINSAISPDVNEEVIKSTFEKYYDELSKEINKSIENTEENKTNLSDLVGHWQLEYTKMDKSIKGGEKMRLEADGKYILQDNPEKYYFQLNVLDIKGQSIIWQKLQVINNSATESVHAIETLQKSNDGRQLEGTDSLGFELKYTKMD